MPDSSHPAAMDRPALQAALRARLGRQAATLGEADAAPAAAGGSLPLCAAIDQSLPGRGGLARAALHEVVAADPGAATGFCALLLARARGTGPGTVLWIAAAAWPPGLTRFGLSPAALVQVRAERTEDGLWAMEEALRCPAVAAALLVAPAALDLAAARRLQLAAEAGGGLGLVLRPEAEEGEDSTALASRWRVSPLAGGGASGGGLGDPRWRLDLLRSGRGTGGRPQGWQVVWRPAAERLELDSAEQPETGEEETPKADVREPAGRSVRAPRHRAR